LLRWREGVRLGDNKRERLNDLYSGSSFCWESRKSFFHKEKGKYING